MNRFDFSNLTLASKAGLGGLGVFVLFLIYLMFSSSEEPTSLSELRSIESSPSSEVNANVPIIDADKADTVNYKISDSNNKIITPVISKEENNEIIKNKLKIQDAKILELKDNVAKLSIDFNSMSIDTLPKLESKTTKIRKDVDLLSGKYRKVKNIKRTKKAKRTRHQVKLLEIDQYGPFASAVVEVNGKTYTASIGESFGKWTLKNVELPNCIFIKRISSKRSTKVCSGGGL